MLNRKTLIKKVVAGCLAFLTQSGNATMLRVPSVLKGRDCEAVVDAAAGTLQISEFPARWSDLPMDPSRVTRLLLSNGLTTWPKGVLNAFVNLEHLEVYGPAPVSTAQAIALDAGSDFIPHKKNLKTLQLPSLVTQISNRGFSQCPHLTSVDLPPSFDRLEPMAFWHCPELRVVDLSKCQNLTVIPDLAFGGCVQLRCVKFPPRLVAIERGAFEETQLHPRTYEEIRKDQIERRTGTKIVKFEIISTTVLPAEMPLSEQSRREAEERNRELRECRVNLPNTVTNIGRLAFSRSALTDFWAPSSLKVLGPKAFTLCTNLRSVNLSACQEITEILPHTFESSSIGSIVLPPVLQKIGESAFSFCQNLHSIGFPETLATIETQAFRNCKSLETIIFPTSLQQIGAGAFFDAGLTTVLWRGDRSQVNIGEQAFYQYMAILKKIKHYQLDENGTGTELSELPQDKA